VHQAEMNRLKTEAKQAQEEFATEVANREKSLMTKHTLEVASLQEKHDKSLLAKEEMLNDLNIQLSVLRSSYENLMNSVSTGAGLTFEIGQLDNEAAADERSEILHKHHGSGSEDASSSTRSGSSNGEIGDGVGAELDDDCEALNDGGEISRNDGTSVDSVRLVHQDKDKELKDKDATRDELLLQEKYSGERALYIGENDSEYQGTDNEFDEYEEGKSPLFENSSYAVYSNLADDSGDEMPGHNNKGPQVEYRDENSEESGPAYEDEEASVSESSSRSMESKRRFRHKCKLVLNPTTGSYNSGATLKEPSDEEAIYGRASDALSVGGFDDDGDKAISDNEEIQGSIADENDSDDTNDYCMGDVAALSLGDPCDWDLVSLTGVLLCQHKLKSQVLPLCLLSLSMELFASNGLKGSNSLQNTRKRMATAWCVRGMIPIQNSGNGYWRREKCIANMKRKREAPEQTSNQIKRKKSALQS